MYSRVIVVIILMANFQNIRAFDYCRKDHQAELCGIREHIYCHPEQLVKRELGELYGVVPMTPLLKRKLIDFHNIARNTIACGFEYENKEENKEKFPKAAALRKVIWEDELEFLAEKHVRQCNEQKDNCHETYRFTNTGQNLCMKTDNVSMPIVELIDVCLNGWFNEYKSMQSVENVVENYRLDLTGSKEFDRFVLMISQETSRIGCAISLCQKEKLEERYNYLMVCNYDDAVYNGEHLYAIAKHKAGSKCHIFGTKLSKKYECLCTNNGKIYYKPDESVPENVCSRGTP